MRVPMSWLRALLPDLTADADEVAAALGRDLPEGSTAPSDVIDLLVAASEPGLTAMPSGRFYGMVIGGTHPAALAADWLVSACDQNAGLRDLTPAAAAVEEVTAAWLLELLGLPVQIAPVEETVWSKAYVMERERFDVLSPFAERGQMNDHGV